MTIPIVPIVLQDRYFRGLEIEKGYVKGEWDANFTKTTVTITQPSGTKMTGQVSSTGPFIVIAFPDGSKISSLWQLEPAQVVDFFGVGLGCLQRTCPYWLRPSHDCCWNERV